MASRLARVILATVGAIAVPLFAFAPAYAGSQASAAQAQPSSTTQAPRTHNPNRQVCTVTRITGSRFPRRICRSAGDRATAEREAQDTTRDFLANDYVEPPELTLSNPANPQD
jgi:hypothetical protein